MTQDALECQLEENVKGLLSELTLEEKISLMSGQDFWSLNGIPRLNIPSLRVADGPTGLRSTNSEASTVFPVGIALGATWNPALVEQVGAAIGREAIAHDVDVLLAPTVNIVRAPLGGRNFECYSEDPLLSGSLGAAYASGVQSEGVGTSVKHYVANNQEHERMRGSSNVSERALREIYLASFEKVVADASPWTIMGAYNRINGVFACEHDELVNTILKSEWGWDGVYLSDWTATKSTVASALGGLDLEMPGPGMFFGDALVHAVEAGEVPEDVIDDAVSRLLRLIIRCGLMDGNPKKARGALRTQEHRDLSRAAARESFVLLKNEGNLLPIVDVERLAIIGSPANQPAIQGGGSSQVVPDRLISPLEALYEALGSSMEITFGRGVDPEPNPPLIDRRLLSPDINASEHGLTAKYYSNSDLTGFPVYEELDPNFSKLGFGAQAQSADDPGFSVEWTGYFTPRYSGQHEFLVAHSNPEIELAMGDHVLIDPSTGRETELLFMILPLGKRMASIDLEAGKAYPITLRYLQPAGSGVVGFNILNVGLREPAPDYGASIEIAKQADRAIVFVGSGTTSETEGRDRETMRLSDSQNQLVEDVITANPSTIVVVNSGAPIEMPWADRVPAILQMWLPGQESGYALADILSGNASPSGKLPVSFPKRLKDNPTALTFPGGLQADYGEGVFVGYRYYDAIDRDPLFPFGHGLTYSQFTLSSSSINSEATIGETVELSVLLTNDGDQSASETVQLYVEDLATTESMPPRQLRAFEKVGLHAGESRELKFTLSRRDFAWFDPDSKNWVVTPGHYRVHVGTSSRDLPIAMDLKLSR